MARRGKSSLETLAPLPVIVLRTPNIKVVHTLNMLRQLRISSNRPAKGIFNMR